MWLIKLSLLLLVGASLAQQDDRQNSPTIRRLRFRKQRPKLASINNENGVAQGLPIPLRNAGIPVDQLLAQQDQQPDTASLLQAAIVDEGPRQRPQRPRPGQSLQSTDALESLLATASRDIDPLPQEEVLFEEPLEPVAPVRQQPQQQRPAGRTRRPPGVPRRTQVRARPVANELDREIPRRLPQQEQERDEPIKTIERYSHKNEDGSFTFGYMAEDGSFREETRGVDCITRGKYGYVDPDGKRREFTYVSGLPCEITGEEPPEGEDLQAIEDPISPSERFKSSSTQLGEEELSQIVRQRQRQPIRRPAQVVDDQADAAPQDNFSSFSQRPHVRDPATRRRPAGRRPAAGDDNAFNNLLNIANEDQASGVQPTPLPVRARPTPTRARPTPTRPSNFNFDSELDDFALGVNPRRPALTFEGEQPRQQAGAPTPVGPSFTSELVFDPSSGTFKTELRQNVGGGAQINLRDDAAPGARRPATPTPTPAARRPTPTAFAPTQRPATPTPFTAFSPTPSRPASSGGSSITFQPLSFPDPSTVVTQRPATPTPTAPARPVTPVPTRPPTPAPTQPSRPPPTPTQPANSFFFQPLPTVGSPRPVAAGQPATPRPVTQPASVFPAGTFTLGTPTPQAARPAPPQPARPAPTPARPAPPTPNAAGRPQIQFGFSPITAQPQQQGRPFTAFSAGTPPQLNGAPSPAFQSRPQTFAPRPPQPQFQSRPPPNPQAAFQAFPQAGRPQQLGIPPQLQGGARFSPFGRPGARPPPPQSSPFTVFNPATIRGA